MLNLMAWLEVHRNQVLGGLMAVVVLIGIGYLWHYFAERRELQAETALFDVQLQTRSAEGEKTPTAADYLKVAEAHPSTEAALRARLLAAGAYFSEGRYAQSLELFQKILDSEKTGPLAAQAAFGVAASLDAEGKAEDAAKRYQEVPNQFPDSSVAMQARLALAGIEESRNQPAAALRLYDEVMRDREGGPLTQQAAMERDGLMRRHPELANASTNTVGSNLAAPNPAATDATAVAVTATNGAAPPK